MIKRKEEKEKERKIQKQNKLSRSRYIMFKHQGFV